MRSGPYFYLPKMQSHLEARLWNDVFVEAQVELGVPRGSIRVSSAPLCRVWHTPDLPASPASMHGLSRRLAAGWR